MGASVLGRGVRGLLLVQLLLAAVVSLPLFVAAGPRQVLSLWFGMSMAAINTVQAARCADRDARFPERKPQQSLAAVFICVVQRFVVAALLFAFGLGGLKLPPLALLAGFIAGQLVMVIMGTQQLKK